jgi:hypothetical protein
MLCSVCSYREIGILVFSLSVFGYFGVWRAFWSAISSIDLSGLGFDFYNWFVNC